MWFGRDDFELVDVPTRLLSLLACIRFVGNVEGIIRDHYVVTYLFSCKSMCLLLVPSHDLCIQFSVFSVLVYSPTFAETIKSELIFSGSRWSRRYRFGRAMPQIQGETWILSGSGGVSLRTHSTWVSPRLNISNTYTHLERLGPCFETAWRRPTTARAAAASITNTSNRSCNNIRPNRTTTASAGAAPGTRATASAVQEHQQHGSNK